MEQGFLYKNINVSNTMYYGQMIQQMPSVVRFKFTQNAQVYKALRAQIVSSCTRNKSRLFPFPQM